MTYIEKEISQECKHFIDYASTSQKLQSYISENNQLPLFTNIDYEEGYRETLDEIFDYTIYEDGDKVIVKVHMDYLKQHNCAAFPTWIFFRVAEEYPDIEYRITSKNKAEIVHKVIKVEAMNI